MRAIRLSLFTITLLTACAPTVDNPDNPPRLGSWSDTMVIDRITLNDLSIPRSDLSESLGAQLTAMEKSDRKCIEPALRDKDEVQALINQRLKWSCDLEELTHTPYSMEAIARCEPKRILGSEIIPTIRAEGTISENKVNLRIRSIMRIPSKSGSNAMIVVSAHRELTREGDC